MWASAYEMGFMRALGRPIFAYSNDSRSFLDRIAAFCGGSVRMRPSGEHEDPDGMAIEPFTLHDNLMLAGGIVFSGGCMIAEAVPHGERYHVTRSLRALCRTRRGGAAPVARPRPFGDDRTPSPACVIDFRDRQLFGGVPLEHHKVALLNSRPWSPHRDVVLGTIGAIINGQFLTDHDLPQRDEIVPVPGARVGFR